MPRYKLTLEYDGTPFSGWQRQPHAPSVQATLEAACLAYCGEDVTAHCAGRTDAGVHALGQVAHMDIARGDDGFRVREALNAHLRGSGVVVCEAQQVDDSFHARFSAVRRHYLYRIVHRRAPLALDAQRAWHIPYPLDEDTMREAASYLLGQHDFTSFRDSECQAESPIRTLDALDIHRIGEELHLRLHARSFLHHQVRIITGTLIEVARGKRSAHAIHDILKARQRCAAGVTAPAHGLYFTHVDYDTS
ncbi:MAG: tRNA pseudouridine(38-40) synthase TruA [Alphaproteobacteria bacterium]|nr:MAG: tRNA pseudouridine(38-40) synthase TruA [Alphaproteobacteria bacterium]TAF15228.1 MAG: tRNA pseudouridine(38-40) synthase TruA [Alphaproteobacteria bacterium]TAF38993.1 MAG: tRNA pseudouridine(38-40) synthase TruA [Alphaproteobacteria bacterium]TAF76302.1 MAG: tRNA pseudouridine(38-40) synthase TruA [Alphaproteobacteria bacterium]